MKGKYYARRSKDKKRAQLLITHLVNVANLCKELALPQFKTIAYLLGLLHDLGKYNTVWQEDYLFSNKKQRAPSNHTFAGAKIADENKLGNICTAIIHGHHRGLLPLVDGDTRKPFSRLKAALDVDLRTGRGDENYQSFLEQLEKELGHKVNLSIEKITPDDAKHGDMIARVLFATLIHADRTDAQAFEENKPFIPAPKWNGIVKLPTHQVRSTFDELKRDYGNAIAESGSNPKGIYKMYGITGIGKTEASLRFAIEHINHHPELRGVVYVGPLKTVIGQTWRTYEQVLGKDNVLIHYSDHNVDGNQKEKYRQSSETWDVNFIVTSCVQFFESYYSNYPRKCRKLANLANRIIIVDEAQLIPNKYLGLCLDTCEMLVKYLGCTVLLMSATHPHYGKIAAGKNGISRPEYPELCADNLNWKRLEKKQQEISDNHVDYNYYSAEQSTWEAIAQEILACRYQYSLNMFNTVATAEEGCQQLSKLVPGRWILITAKNCPREQQDLIDIMPWSAHQWGEGCLHVICTSLLGAGVNINFPLGNIEITGIDSIFQFKGRINREFLLYLIMGVEKKSKVNIFDMGSCLDPERAYMITEARKLLEVHGTINTEIIDKYYKALAIAELDDQNLILKRNEGDFGYVNNNFKLIHDYKNPVLTQYKEGKRFVELYDDREEPLNIAEIRRIQPYCGKYSDNDIKQGIILGTIKRSPTGLYYLV